MQYPLISEYLAAIRDAKENLDKLSHLVPVLDKYGEPYRSSGAFAVVFKMKDEQTGKCYALKCFTEEQEGRAEAYRQIAEEFEFVDSSYITSVKYQEKELFVDSNCENEEFPVLLMDWIEGETMETYVAANYTDTLDLLALFEKPDTAKLVREVAIALMGGHYVSIPCAGGGSVSSETGWDGRKKDEEDENFRLRCWLHAARTVKNSRKVQTKRKSYGL